ncbi:hypothetical protein Pars_2363 [Pyrobaculum arsenaticum DSM 13514]|uniref:Uncharacterized protein n=1 Tax=Pyrobaculum arsenaticum (strain DSM 13514 / JCM 11321 / PZ6) TaxID=340102 RepID=A4WND9_PYRAR|nr:hypothetical protein Pars_2363 [Pyrobaculum arsenaticum DSM 13514]
MKSIIGTNVQNQVSSFCTVIWRGEKYRVLCTPSYLLSVATKIAEAERVSYFDIYKRLVASLGSEYSEARAAVSVLLSEK